MALCKHVHGPDPKIEAPWAMSWCVWGLDHCHGLETAVAHRLEHYISVWYCGWTLEGLHCSFQPKLPIGVPDLGASLQNGPLQNRAIMSGCEAISSS